jgi:hypothetical protein
MPNFDGTGPQGQGAMTGRKRGRCRDKQTTKTEKSETKSVEKNKSVYRLGRRNGRGRGQSDRNQ